MSHCFATFQATKCVRVIATRHPPIALFERIAAAKDSEALNELESAFSPHYAETMLLPSLPKSAWVCGLGAGYIMAPFVYMSPTRFSNGTFGAFYAGLDEETAIREVAYHRGLFMAATSESATVLEEQILQAKVTAELVDIRGQPAVMAGLYHPSDYSQSQAFGVSVFAEGHAGITFTSVRRPEGNCVAVYRPKAISDCRQMRPLRYVWDGRRIAGWA